MREETICSFSRKSGKVCSVCDVRAVRQCGPSWGGGDCVFLLWLLFCVTCICLCRPPVLWPLPCAQSAVCYTPWPLCWWCRSLSPQSPSTPDLCQPPTCSSETRNMFLSTSPQVLQLYTNFLPGSSKSSTWVTKKPTTQSINSKAPFSCSHIHNGVATAGVFAYF